MKDEEKCDLREVKQYTIGAKLQEGTFGEVKVAVNRDTGEECAVKIVNWRKIRKARLEAQMDREIGALRSLNHVNVLRAKDVIRNNKFVFIVTELVRGGDLFDYLDRRGSLTESEALFFFRQLIEGLRYCHEHNVCHRDLKLENVLLTEDRVLKIADFGYCQAFWTSQNHEEIMLKTSCGTPHYIAPEILRFEEYSGPQVDVWAAGVVLYALVSGVFPFEGDDDRQLFRSIAQARLTVPPSFSRELRDLITRMLAADPQDRICLSEIFEHPFVTRPPEAWEEAAPAPAPRPAR